MSLLAAVWCLLALLLGLTSCRKMPANDLPLPLPGLFGEELALPSVISLADHLPLKIGISTDQMHCVETEENYHAEIFRKLSAVRVRRQSAVPASVPMIPFHYAIAIELGDGTKLCWFTSTVFAPNGSAYRDDVLFVMRADCIFGFYEIVNPGALEGIYRFPFGVCDAFRYPDE